MALFDDTINQTPLAGNVQVGKSPDPQPRDPGVPQHRCPSQIYWWSSDDKAWHPVLGGVTVSAMNAHTREVITGCSNESGFLDWILPEGLYSLSGRVPTNLPNAYGLIGQSFWSPNPQAYTGRFQPIRVGIHGPDLDTIKRAIPHGTGC